MEKQKEYFAFISYKREDEKWAKWLQHKLEHYHLPTNVRKENPSLPQAIRPVFKDTSELAAGVLAEEIHEALENSNYLIVICSPRAAQSKWVGKEVQTFIDMGRTDKIIPFIIGGTPFSDDPQEECFPSTLLELPKEQELLGVNINEMGRDAAVVKVVARMFGLKFDTLWQRHEREQKKKRSLIIGIAVLVGIIGIGMFLYYRMLNNTITEKNRALMETINDRDLALKQVRQDSVALVNHLVRILHDSLVLEKQKDSIRLQKDEISKERDNVKNANYEMWNNYVRFIAEKANDLINDGDTYDARLLLLSVVENVGNPKCYPQAIEWERSLRRAVGSNSGILRHNDDVSSLCFSDTGDILVSSDKSGAIVLWDVKSGSILKKSIKDNNRIEFVKFSPDGRFIAINVAGGIKLYSSSTFEKIDQYRGKTWIKTLTFSKNGDFLIFDSGDHHLAFRKVSNKSMYYTKDKHGGEIESICLSADGNKIVTASSDSTIKIWDYPSGKLLKTLKGHDAGVKSAVWGCGNKLIASASKDKTVRLWNFESGECIDTLFGHYGWVTSVVFNKEGTKLFSASEDHDIRVWNIKRGICEDVFKGHGRMINQIVLSPNGNQLASASNDLTVRLWNVGNHDFKIKKWDVGEAKEKLMVSPNGTDWVAVGKRIVIGNIYSDTTFTINEYASFASFSPDGKKIIASCRGKCKIWDVDTKKLLKEFDMFPANSVFLNNTCNMAIATGGKNAIIWDLENGTIKQRLIGHEKEVKYAVFSPDGRLVASVSNDLRLWDVKSGQCIDFVLNPDHYFSSVVFSPDGKYLLAGSYDNRLYLCRVPSLSLEKAFEGHIRLVKSCFFNKGANRIISSAWDNTCRIWDIESGMEVESFPCSGSSYESFCGKDSFIIGLYGTNVYLKRNSSCSEILKDINQRFKSCKLNEDEYPNVYPKK